ncbi:hypothetical protein AB0K30_26730, partial [Micromonospora sp. NPDC053811]
VWESRTPPDILSVQGHPKLGVALNAFPRQIRDGADAIRRSRESPVALPVASSADLGSRQRPQRSGHENRRHRLQTRRCSTDGGAGDLPRELFAGTLVIDADNYYPDRDGDIPELVDG